MMDCFFNMNNNQQVYNNYNDLCKCNVTLANNELWKQFEEHETEMIITKSGRRMFPIFSIQITELDPHAHYCILLEMTLAANCRYKYSNSERWIPAGSEETQNPQRVHLHPDSPATGEYWMSQTISFKHLKLTNTQAPPMGHLVLSSMHKYQPRVIIAKTSDPRNTAWAPTSSCFFKETQFIAVTAYQNEKITKLKIDNNPFAKGFRENGQANCKRKLLATDDKNEEKCRKKIDTPSLKSEDDSISSCSSSSCHIPSPELSTRIPENDPIFCPRPIYPQPTMNFYPYYYPHYPFYPQQVWGPPQFYVQPSFQSTFRPAIPEDLRVPTTVQNEPRKLTDFSIRAITGEK